MLSLPGYQISQLIQVGIKNAIYRGIRQIDGTPVIIKTLIAEFPALEDITRLRHEYKIVQNLHLEGVVKTYSLEKAGNGYALVMEDLNGASLKQLLATQTVSIEDFFKITLQLTSALTELHKNHIIHKDIKPSNIIINLTSQQVKLIDFSIATNLNRELPTIENPSDMEGTLAYMSPEQTGRMNRTVDYRTDFYSLGITCYEMLANRLPYTTLDPLELVYSHLAKSPEPLHELNPEVPEAVSAIVMKLLAKNAEDRYQSAVGLRVDLENCFNQLKTTGRIVNFTPGLRDRSGQFLIPQKLYGRETEVASLLTAFERISKKAKKNRTPASFTREMILVSGYSGIGKTSVVQEIHKPILRKRGYFIAGKFDQFKRNIPYAAIVQAFQELVRQLLTESDERIEAWKTRLIETLGSNGKVITDVIPEVELIMGPQPEVPQIEPTATQNRFKVVFKQFISVFAQLTHPLVLFLDDLQWVDLASLNLIQLLMTDPDIQSLLLIGAYRDNEVTPAHPLILAVEEIKKTEAIVNQIILKPLTLKTVGQIVADTLHERKPPLELSQLIFNKTQGNPFFMTQLMQTLHSENLFQFDFDRGRWQWNLEEIQAIGITDYSVVELVARNLRKLPEVTQDILKLAACLGNQFYLDVLAIVSEESQVTVATHLWEALQAGLLLPLSKEYKIPLLVDVEEPAIAPLENLRIGYKFLHDRVQQAAYSLILEEEKKNTHFKIGKLLLSHTPESEREENIFDIVNQLNYGTDLLSDRQDYQQFAELNLLAGRKAKASAAYAAAVSYFAVGRKLLTDDCWQTQYDLALALYTQAAETAYLSTDFEAMEELATVVLEKARTLLDRVLVYEVKLSACTAQINPQQAVAMGLQVLQLLDVHFPDSPTPEDIQQKIGETALLLAETEVASLINLPEMAALDKQAALRILSSLVSPAYITAPAYLPLIILEMVQLSIHHGNAPLSAFAYGLYGLLLSGVLQEIERGYQFGQLALNIVDRFQAHYLKTKIFYTVAAHLLHGKHSLKEALILLREGYLRGLETGELETGYSAKEISQFSYLSGHYLKDLEQEVASYSKALAYLRQSAALNYNQIVHQAILNLLKPTIDPCHFRGEVYDEEKRYPLHLRANDRNGLHYFHFHKMVICYLFEDAEKALENAIAAEQHIDAVTGMLNVPTFYFYDSLVRLAICSQLADRAREEHLLKVQSNQEKLQLWADQAPINFLHKFYLVEAERDRLDGNLMNAMEAYDRAIALAKEHEYVNEEAIANELTGKFYLAWHKEKIAKTYLTEAYYGYIRWGAIAKAKALDSHYPHLIFRSISPEIAILETPSITGSTRSTNSTSTTTSLDIMTVMKAAQALSGELALDSLLTKLMIVLIESAGAQSGHLILQRTDKLTIEVSATSTKGDDFTVHSRDLTPELLPLSVINYTARSLKSLVLNQATNDPTFGNDPYIKNQKSQSILCSPILNQGKLIGILYVENNVTTGAFTKERIDVLNILCVQAAISLENALLYSNLERSNQQLESANEELEIANQQLAEYSQTLEAKVEERTAELKAAQKQIIANEKLASLGTLTAGVAHELRNPLNFVNNFAESSILLTEELLEEIQSQADKIDTDCFENIAYILEELKGNAADINQHGKRAENIIKNMMMHARIESGQAQPTDLNELLAQAVDLAYHSKRAHNNHFNLTINSDYDPSVGLVEVSASDLSRAFINLIDNACYAIDTHRQQAGDSFTPTLSVKTVNCERMVEIRIRDNGTGISPDIQEKIFHPFFTTKPAGEGTGLGLSLTHDIVVGQHQGSIYIDTELGKGTEFIIRLPKKFTTLY